MNFQNDHPNLEYLQRINYPSLPSYTYNNKTFKSATHALNNYINEYYLTKNDISHNRHFNNINQNGPSKIASPHHTQIYGY